MKRFLKDYRLHEHTEALFLLTLGIIIQVLDGSPLDVWNRWSLAWETEFPREFFSLFMQQIIKTVLSIIILVRCMTTVLYVLFGLITLYCILRETSPKLMLPWLFISGLKSVVLTFLETLTGVYVCSAFGKVRKPCIEFVVSKAIELFFAIYLWACIRSIHKDFEQFEENYREEELLTKMVIHRVNLRRRRARSMIDESTLYKTSNLNYFGLKDVPNIIFDMLKTEDELSQDSLLSPGMMLASVSNMGSYDYLKTSLSLGELGVIDLNSFQVAGLDDYRYLSPRERAMKFLRLSRDDIRKARERTKSKSFSDNYKVPLELLRNLTEEKPLNTLNKLPRQNELFAAKLPELDKVKEHLNMKKARRKSHRDILSGSVYSQEEAKASAEQFVRLEDGDRYEEDEEGEGEEEDEEEEGGNTLVTGESDGENTPNLWFMTNIKDQVNRIGLMEAQNSKRSGNYERLYRQDFMSAIGAEVFDRASKLVKLTSLSDVISGDNYENELDFVPPSTSRGVNAERHQSTEESVETRKPGKNKKLAFEDRLDRSTAMPVSVIVTNFPIQFDSRIRKCEALYFRETTNESPEILLLPKRAIERSSEISDGGSSSNEKEEGISDSSTTATLSAADDWQISEGNKLCRTFAETEDSKNDTKVNLFILKCSRGTTPKSWYERREPKLHNFKDHTSSRELIVFEADEQESPMMNSSGVMDDRYRYRDRSYIYPRTSEQMIFIRDMMRRPLREVLRYYYHLREAEDGGTGMKRICSNDSVRIGNGLTMRQISRFDAVRSSSQEATGNTSMRAKSSTRLSSLEKKAFVDCETQVSFGEEGLRSTETITLGSPKTKKLETNSNDLLPPLYLFGNKDLGWSSSPLDVSLGRQIDPKESETTRKGMKSSHLLLDGSTEDDNTILPNLLTSSDVSCKVVLSPGQRNTVGEESFSSAQDQMSIDAIPTSDDNKSMHSSESDESFSLFYSKTADLASPLLDMRRFIYLDHIHYSYKNVKKKGFDVEINPGLPLLVRDSLTLNPSMKVKRIETPPDPQTGITRRPMDLTFANLNMFPKEGEQPEPSTSNLTDGESGESNPFEMTKMLIDSSHELMSHSASMKEERKFFRKFFGEEKGTNPDDFYGDLFDTNSMNLHSNKGKVGMLSNPAVILQSSKMKKLRMSRMKKVVGSL